MAYLTPITDVQASRMKASELYAHTLLNLFVEGDDGFSQDQFFQGMELIADLLLELTPKSRLSALVKAYPHLYKTTKEKE